MALPRILLAVPLIAAGAFLPAVGHAPEKAPAGVVGMGHEVFTTNETSIQRGASLRFVNDSRFMHIIGPGRDGTLVTSAQEPMHRRVLMPESASYTTPPFKNAGTFYFSCSMHPKMTVKVVVNG
jgi:plastocyanin